MNISSPTTKRSWRRSSCWSSCIFWVGRKKLSCVNFVKADVQTIYLSNGRFRLRKLVMSLLKKKKGV
ncbi:hypothetical protein L6452_25519 [Arctium lappa]|uniref:Uncharacterized protein n=1 Tax=Arctium lappa TaxID=4217 RepID=A0ACB9ABI4_ARCLA|nr:hypothetical protein L6452_25519 [Arctium lappa]